MFPLSQNFFHQFTIQSLPVPTWLSQVSSQFWTYQLDYIPIKHFSFQSAVWKQYKAFHKLKLVNNFSEKKTTTLYISAGTRLYKCDDSLRTAAACRGVRMKVTIPGFSVMSTSSGFIPSGNSHLKWCRRCPNIDSTRLITQLCTRAHPSSSSKGQHAEIVSLDINILLFKSFWPELQWILPQLGVTSDGPHVDMHSRSFGDVVSANLDVGGGLVGEHEGSWPCCAGDNNLLRISQISQAQRIIPTVQNNHRRKNTRKQPI